MRLSLLSFAFLLSAGATLVVADDLGDAFRNLQQAESKKDAAGVKKLAVETYRLARQETSASAPESAEEKDAWAKRIAYLREVEVRTEYSLFATAVGVPPATTVDLLSTLEQLNPKSKYLDQAYSLYMQALNQTGAASQMLVVAEKALAHFPDNEDLLLVLADSARNRKQNDRALSYADRLVAALSKHPKPEGMSAADWERKRNAALGRGYWIAGMVHLEKKDLFDGDRDLRAALPLIKGNNAMLISTLVQLSLVNYQLGGILRDRQRVLEASRFSDQAAAIPGEHALQAWRNAQAMRNEAAKMR